MNSYLAVLPVLMLSAGLVLSGSPGESSAISENIHTHDEVNVIAYVNGEEVAETHNVLMDGEKAIEEQIKNGDTLSWDTIAVGYGDEPTTDDSTLPGEHTDCGLSPEEGTFDDTGEDGTWNLSASFDVTCDDQNVNNTAQLSTEADSDMDYFAGADLGRTINLYEGDSLTIEWSNEVQ